MVTKETLKEFISRAYSTACNHGFHDKEFSVEHFLMLAVSEVGEMVESDRKSRYADMDSFLKHAELSYDECFACFVKDTVEDEMSDVAIRLFDICGTFGIEPYYANDDDGVMKDEFFSLFEEYDFCSRCYVLSSLLCRYDSGSMYDDGSDDCLPFVIGCALSYLFCLADYMGVDLVRHIQLKMRYNESRPRLHGKSY